MAGIYPSRAMDDDENSPDRFPPPLPPQVEGEQPSWVLLDLFAYIADRKNSTSACTKMSDGTRIRITLCAAPPPLVSYLCAWCPDQEPGETPRIRRCLVEAADSDLIFLYASLRPRRFGSCNSFVYRAGGSGGSGGKGPSLHRIELPYPSVTTHHDIALLPYSDLLQAEKGRGSRFRLFPHDHDDEEDSVSLHRPEGNRFLLRRHGEENSDFCVARLKYKGSSGAEHHNYELCVFHSTNGQWRHMPFSITISCGRKHITYKAINLGQGGLIGFVDPWRGIIVCDVLGRRPPQYLPLPAEPIDDRIFDMPLLYRDIALVEGRLTVVNLCDVGELDTDLNCQAWELSTWSRKVSHFWEEDWSQDYIVQSGDFSLKDATGVDLLPKVIGSMRPTLELPYMAHPTLSLRSSHVVYVMGKLGYHDKKVLLMPLNLKERRLQEVTMFNAERMVGVPFDYSYIHSRIPIYFKADVGGNLKRPGMFNMIYPHKLHALCDETYMQISGGVHEQHEAGSSKGAEHTEKCYVYN